MENFKQRFQALWNIRWLRRSVISAITIALILLIIPVIIQFSIPYLLKQQGADTAQIEDINLNLFAGTFELKQLSMTTKDSEPARIKHIAADLQMLDLFSSQVIVNELVIDGLKANIRHDDNGDISINGLLIPVNKSAEAEPASPTETVAAPLQFAVNNLIITNSAINYQEPDFSQNNTINSISLTNLKSWDTSNYSTLKLDLLLNDAPFKLSAKLNLFNDIKHFKGTGSLGDLTFTPYKKFYQAHLDNLQGAISLDTEFDISLSEKISANLSNSVEITALELDYNNLNQQVKKITWQGETELSKDGEVTIKGNLDINNNRTKDKKQDYLISSFEHLSINGFEKKLQSVQFDQFEITNLNLINTPHSKSFVELNKASIQKLSYQIDSPQLNINLITLNKPEVQITLTEQKQLLQLSPLFKTLDTLNPAADETATQQDETDPKKPLVINIKNILLKEPGLADITDNSVSPSYKTVIHLNQLDVKNLSSNESAHFKIGLKQGDYTLIDINGDGLIFNPAESLQFKADIKQLDLAPVTPYTSKAMGYGMKSGVVDSTINVKLKQREIDAEIELKIDSIEVVETSKETAEQVSSASGMSIDLAISALKDSDNVIDLKLPVKGNIDNPDFDLSLIINRAMGKAMKSATMSYLKHSLQPLGSLITLYSLAKKAANHISLPPILFNSNSLTMKDDQRKLLDKVIKVLKERPGLKIKACGISALEDQKSIRDTLVQAEVTRLKELNKKAGKKKAVEINMEKIEVDKKLVQQKMRELADSRSAKVKAVFVEQGKLESSRILNCLSASNTEEKSLASVELLI